MTTYLTTRYDIYHAMPPVKDADPKLWPHGKRVLVYVKTYYRPHWLVIWKSKHQGVDMWVRRTAGGQGNNVEWLHDEVDYVTPVTEGEFEPYPVAYTKSYTNAQIVALFEVLSYE